MKSNLHKEKGFTRRVPSSLQKALDTRMTNFRFLINYVYRICFARETGILQLESALDYSEAMWKQKWADCDITPDSMWVTG